MPPPTSCKPQAKDMYWFAHGGIEPPPSPNQGHQGRSSTPGPGDTEDESSENNSLTWKSSNDRRATSEEPVPVAKQKSVDQPDGVKVGGFIHINSTDKRQAVEERKKQMLETEQEKNDAILKKHAEREAALEARRNAQRSNISFAFGSVVPPNREMDIVPVQQTTPVIHVLPSKNEEYIGKMVCVDNAQPSHDYSSKSVFPESWLTGPGTLMASNLMTQSMYSSGSTARGRRKNDLTPTVPYERVGPSRPTAPSRKRSVSMSRLDMLAQPRRPYVEAQKASSTISSSSSKETHQSANRPLSSASEKNGGHSTTSVSRRPQTAARKPRPISIAGSIPDHKSPRTSTPLKSTPGAQNKQPDFHASMISSASNMRNMRAKSASCTNRSAKVSPEKKTSKPPVKVTAPKPQKPTITATPKQMTTLKQVAAPKPSVAQKQSTPKTSPARKQLTNKKQATMLVGAAEKAVVEIAKQSESPARSVSPDEDSQSADDKSSSKRIISEEEAKAALAEKRRLAREQAEKEAELEKERLEKLKQEEEERLRKEEEDHRRMEEEQLRLLEEHRQFEEEKLKKAIEEQEQKEEEEKAERAKREEEAQLRAEQEKKAKEEAEKQRIELEEKLRKEEEERAERKKRLEKIMSRTRGKSGTVTPGSGSGSDQPDSIESQHEGLSSELSSLESNPPGKQDLVDIGISDQAVEQSSPSESLDINETLYLASQSLSSNDLMLPSSANTSLDGSQAIQSEHASLDSDHSAFSVQEKTFIEKGQVDETIECSSEGGETCHASEENSVCSLKDVSLKFKPDTLEGEPAGDGENVLAGDKGEELGENVLLPSPISTEHSMEKSILLDTLPDEITVEDKPAAVNQEQNAPTQSKEESNTIRSFEENVVLIRPDDMLGNVDASVSLQAEEKEFDSYHLHGMEFEKDPDIGNTIEQSQHDSSSLQKSDQGVFNTESNNLLDTSFESAFPPATTGTTRDVENIPPAFDLSADFNESKDKIAFPEAMETETGQLIEKYKSENLSHEIAQSENLHVFDSSNFCETSITTMADIENYAVDDRQEILARDSESVSKHNNGTMLTSVITDDPFTAQTCKNPFTGDPEFGCDDKVNHLDVTFVIQNSSDTVLTDICGNVDDPLMHLSNKDIPSSENYEDTSKSLPLLVDNTNSDIRYQLESIRELESFDHEDSNERVLGLTETKRTAFDCNSDTAKLEQNFQHADSHTGQLLSHELSASMFDSQSFQIQNPFYDSHNAIPESLYNKSNLEEELISALNNVEDSEGSSLDSNLSQVLNVHSEDVANTYSSETTDLVVNESLVNNTSAVNSQTDGYEQHQFSQKSQPMPEENIPKTNGYSVSINNSNLYDDRFESVDFKADSTSASLFQSAPENGIISGSNASCVNTVDNMNSNKVASNPFLGSSDSNPFCSNPFQLQEEKAITT